MELMKHEMATDIIRAKPCPRCRQQRVEAGWVLNQKRRRALIWWCVCGWAGPRKQLTQEDKGNA